MPGFAFWGLFAVFGLIVVGYVTWMWWLERQEPDE
jgi:cbb3-type cytochrome oxidase subunit 3